MQRHRRGCIECVIHYKWDVREEQHPYVCALITCSFCEGCTWCDLHILVTAPFCWCVSVGKYVYSISESDSLCPMKGRRRYSGLRLLETWSRQEIWEVTLYNLLPSTLASHLITQSGNICRPLAQTATCLFHDEETNISQLMGNWSVR